MSAHKASKRIWSVKEMNQERMMGEKGKKLAPEEPRIYNFMEMDPKPGPELPLLQACRDGDLKRVKRIVFENPKSVIEELEGEEELGCLAVAMIFGRFEIASWLIAEGGANLTVRDGIKNTPLNYAVFLRSPELAKMLIERGADPVENCPEKNAVECHRSLHLAALSGRIDLIELLLAHGSRLDSSVRPGPNLLWSAALGDRIEVVRWANHRDHSLKHAKDEQGLPYFYGAVKYGATKIVKWMVESGLAHPQKAFNEAYPSALHLAAQYGSYEICKWLCKKYDIPRTASTDSDRMTPTLRAACEGRIKCLKLLSKVEGLDAQSSDGANLMLWASGSGSLEMVQYLETKGMTIYTGNSNPWAPIHRAAANGKLNLVEYFVQKHVNFDLVDRSGYTPFLLACVFGKMDVAKFLHGMGASPRTTASNLNAVKLAQENNQLQILKWLYSLDKTLFTELEDPYETPASQGYIDQCRWLHRLPEPLPFKLESIPKVLSICARHGDIKMMKWLKRRNLPFFDPNETVEAPRALTTSVEYNIIPSLQFYLDETDFDGSKIMPSRERHAFLNPTPSSDLIRRSYSKHGSIEAIDILLQLGFSINSCKTGNSRTIVHEMCTTGQLKHLKWIFNYGANLNTLDNDGKSPFYVAVKRGNLRLVRWLLKNGASPHAGNSALPIASRPSTSPKMAAFLRDLYRTDET